MQSPDDLKGLRVLVVEDEAAIALLIEDMLLEYGCEVVGPAGRVDEACELARGGDVDVALLDVNVAGQPVLPVVDCLVERAVPIIFSTGYAPSDLAGRGVVTLEKPFTGEDLRRALLVAAGQARKA